MNEPKLATIEQRVLDAAGTHHDTCRCVICKLWWAMMGPDDLQNYGPFEPREILELDLSFLKLPLIPDPEALLEVPLNTEVVLWGLTPASQAVVLHRAWGQTLVRFLHPAQSPLHPYYVWSAGGGHSLAARTGPEAHAQFLREVDYSMSFWAAQQSRGDSIIFNRHHYRDMGFQSKPSSRLGFSGHLWFLQRLSDNQLLKTNNLWHQGRIPDELNLPDNFKTLTADEVNAIKDPVFLDSPYKSGATRSNR